MVLNDNDSIREMKMILHREEENTLSVHFVEVEFIEEELVEFYLGRDTPLWIPGMWCDARWRKQEEQTSSCRVLLLTGRAFPRGSKANEWHASAGPPGFPEKFPGLGLRRHPRPRPWAEESKIAGFLRGIYVLSASVFPIRKSLIFGQIAVFLVAIRGTAGTPIASLEFRQVSHSTWALCRGGVLIV